MHAEIIPRYVRIKCNNLNRQNLYIAHSVLIAAGSAYMQGCCGPIISSGNQQQFFHSFTERKTNVHNGYVTLSMVTQTVSIPVAISDLACPQESC